MVQAWSQQGPWGYSGARSGNPQRIGDNIYHSFTILCCGAHRSLTRPASIAFEPGPLRPAATKAASQPGHEIINQIANMKKNLLLIAGLALAFTTLPLAAQSAGNGKGKNPNPPANCDGSNCKGGICPNDGTGRGPNPNPGTPRGPRDGYGPGSGNCTGGGYCQGGGQGLQQRARQGQCNGQGQQKRAGQK